MKKKIILIITFTLWLIIINFYNLKFYYHNFEWNKFYKNSNFSGSILEFQKSWNFEWKYNIANALYKQGKYRDALKVYNELLKSPIIPFYKGDEQFFKIFHNIWNTIYKIWEKENDSKTKVKYWKESIESYTNALEIKFNEETNHNLIFVQNKIKIEKEKIKKEILKLRKNN
jgi:Ca-activated chloride channel family protein